MVKKLTVAQKGELERTFHREYRNHIKDGEAAPYAGLMAARSQLIERNWLLAGNPDIPGQDIPS